MSNNTKPASLYPYAPLFHLSHHAFYIPQMKLKHAHNSSCLVSVFSSFSNLSYHTIDFSPRVHPSTIGFQQSITELLYAMRLVKKRIDIPLQYKFMPPCRCSTLLRYRTHADHDVDVCEITNSLLASVLLLCSIYMNLIFMHRKQGWFVDYQFSLARHFSIH